MVVDGGQARGGDMEGRSLTVSRYRRHGAGAGCAREKRGTRLTASSSFFPSGSSYHPPPLPSPSTPAMSDTLPRDLWARQLEALPPRTILTALSTHAQRQSRATDHLAEYLRARANVEHEYVAALQKVMRKFGGDAGFEAGEGEGEGVVWERTVGELGSVSEGVFSGWEEKCDRRGSICGEIPDGWTAAG